MKLKHLAILIFLLLGLSSRSNSAGTSLSCDNVDSLNSRRTVSVQDGLVGLKVAGGAQSSSAIDEPGIIGSWAGATDWMTGRDVGWETFNGSISKGIDVAGGSNLQGSDYVKVIIVLDTTAANQTLCHTVKNQFPAGVGTFPGQAWDMSDTLNPRQLNLCFQEFNPTANSQWDIYDTTGRGEHLWVMLSSYDSTGTTYAGSNLFYTDTLDILYVWIPELAEGHTFFESSPCTLTIALNYLIDLMGVPDSTEISLQWSYIGDDPVDHFDIYYGTSSPANIFADQVPGNTTKYIHTGLIQDQTYFYRVEAHDLDHSLIGETREIEVTSQIVSENVELVNFWNGRSDYADCWGYVDSVTGKEYALLNCRDEGVSIIDLSLDPIEEVGFLPLIANGNDCKDVKVYRHYAITIAQSEPAQIFDISDVTNPVKVSEILPEGGSGAHNCKVDGDYLYIVGNTAVGGLEIYDISNPAVPFKVGSFAPFYYHDIDIYKDTLIAVGPFGDGIDILDISNKAAPTLIKRFNYPGSGAHNAEFLQGMKYVAIGDEIGFSGQHTRIFDLRDLENISLISELIVDSTVTTHNCYEKNGILYVAHYDLGLQLFNVTNPAKPLYLGYYDTYLLEGFSGAWNVYPYFESGKIIISDKVTGLYVVELAEADSCLVQMPGDVDGSGTINSSDVIAFSNYLNGVGSSPIPLANADFNGDCVIDETDLYQLTDSIAAEAVPIQIVDCTCLEPTLPCCLGNSGDLNDDGGDANILDLTYLVDYVFRGGPPSPCDEKADLNNDGTPSNILDLTFLVDFIFRGGPAPGPCY